MTEPGTYIPSELEGRAEPMWFTQTTEDGIITSVSAVRIPEVIMVSGFMLGWPEFLDSDFMSVDDDIITFRLVEGEFKYRLAEKSPSGDWVAVREP